jgi:hypothetical protein
MKGHVWPSDDGVMWRIATRWLDDPGLPVAQLASHVRKFAAAPTTGGAAIDVWGDIYDSDENRRCILRISPAAHLLPWSATRASPGRTPCGSSGFFCMPAAQLNLTPCMNHGKKEVRYPVVIYKMKIGVGPSPIGRQRSRPGGTCSTTDCP